MKPDLSGCVLILVAVLTGGVPLAAFAGQGQTQTASAPQAAPLPAYLTDRGTGLPTSMFGTYIRRGELVVYPFYEYYGDRNFEYKPSEFGVPGDVDFRGRYRANEGILLVAYGLRDNLAFEMEAAVISASFDKSPADASALPARLTESGLGDVEAQLRWRWRKETESRPELFSYTEVVFPHAKAKDLIGTPGWEVKVGTGVIRGFRWGTLTVRGAVEFSQASSSHVDVGEYAVEYPEADLAPVPDLPGPRRHAG